LSYAPNRCLLKPTTRANYCVRFVEKSSRIFIYAAVFLLTRLALQPLITASEEICVYFSSTCADSWKTKHFLFGFFMIRMLSTRSTKLLKNQAIWGTGFIFRGRIISIFATRAF